MTRAIHHFILVVIFVFFENRPDWVGSRKDAGSRVQSSFPETWEIFSAARPTSSAPNTAELSEVPKRHRTNRVSLHAHKTQLEFCFRDSGGSSLVTICIIYLNFRVKAFQHDPFLPMSAKLNCAPEWILACIRVLTSLLVDHDDAAL